jgi:L-amino acid N-acyltransferase YncA
MAMQQVTKQTTPPAFQIRNVTLADMPAVQALYAHYVLHELATFELVPPTLEEMCARRQAILDSNLPYLVALIDDVLVGYAYAASYRPRPAYRYTVEDSVYLSPNHTGKGIGSALLAELIRQCEQGPWRQMVAVITQGGKAGSAELHQKLGFEEVGRMPNVGYKFNRWVGTLIMQRALGEGGNSAPTPL